MPTKNLPKSAVGFAKCYHYLIAKVSKSQKTKVYENAHFNANAYFIQSLDNSHTRLSK